jgi:copper oxidase (laccase) domain-containing protein
MHVIIGPALLQKSYNYQFFDLKDTPTWKSYVLVKDQEYWIDNVGNAADQFTAAGVPKAFVHYSNIDTFTDTRFYSHKRDFVQGIKDQGRFGVVAQMK